jgi:hypothetical protein
MPEGSTKASSRTKMSSPPPAGKVPLPPRFRCYQLDPLQDPRWHNLVEKHPKASVFHTVAWLRALRHTYGYKPVAFTTSPPAGELNNGMVFCRIDSWLTGRRLVSLPFSDHCEPLCDSVEDTNFLFRYLQSVLAHQKWKYLEIRPIAEILSETDGWTGFLPAARYFQHTLDLRPDLDELFSGLDKDSVQRRIQRAERAGLAERGGSSEELLKVFYALFVITRRRQGVPPTPYEWFRNLIVELGEALQIRVAYKGESPIAAIVTLRFKEVVCYKYGCSDTRSNKFGATPWLLWKAIMAAKQSGANEFDMGRTEHDNPGLLAFKNHWVPKPKSLIYWQYPYVSTGDYARSWLLKLTKRAFPFLPNRLLTILGKLIYRHIG